MSQENAILIINAIANKENMAEVQSYLSNIMPVFAKNGGKPIARYKTVENLSGEQSPEMVAIVEFPSADIIREMIQGDDFKSLSESRSKAFTKLNLIISSPM
ncbi:MAG: hypothetical protein ACI8ZM_003489 [Crocinitomix sp.]|jgi:uncharacterized protein (DUF1330 family)